VCSNQRKDVSIGGEPDIIEYFVGRDTISPGNIDLVIELVDESMGSSPPDALHGFRPCDAIVIGVPEEVSHTA